MRPTEPGYYWYMPKFQTNWLGVELFLDHGVLRCRYPGLFGSNAVTAMNGHWGGQIPAPKQD